jgi:hypothetical protein
MENTSERIELTEIFALLLDWRLTLPFEADYLDQTGEHVTHYRVKIRPRSGDWEITNQATSEMKRYRSLTDGPVTQGRGISSQIFLNKSHSATDLAFPLTLPIWGRKDDTFQPVSAQRTGDEAVILLRHQFDPRVFGSLTVDLKRKICVQLSSPYGTRMFTNIIPLSQDF